MLILVSMRLHVEETYEVCDESAMPPSKIIYIKISAADVLDNYKQCSFGML